MDAQVKSVVENSIASELGLVSGDRVLSVNGRRDLEDQLDWQLLWASHNDIELEIQHPDGTLEIYEIEKEDWDELGVTFESPIFTPIKTCNNACPFCFIDQQPEGLRPTLYVKDDDYRLSYFCNTYITLTNLTRHDRQRIERFRPGPLYVSVHCTVPEIRSILLKNSKAPPIMIELQWLASLEIPFHAQLVICPGINDGEPLSQTLNDLYTLSPHCLSVAVVPVGLTNWRQDLPDLASVNQTSAQDVIDRVGCFARDRQNPHFAFASDEFYVRAGQPLPQYEAYGDFPQLDDGVGMGRLIVQEFFEQESRLPKAVSPQRNVLALTGHLGAMMLTPIIQRLNQIEGLWVDLVAIENRFWGEAVTVSGLITGQDIRTQLAQHDLSGYDEILIPATMLKSGEPVFLDGVRVSDLETGLNCPIRVVNEPTRAQSLIQALF